MENYEKKTNRSLKKMLQLFIAFFKIGLFTFGGGYAMLPMLEREIIEKKNWATEEELLDYFAIAQCTPGVIAVNTATFIGKKEGGWLGALFSTLGVIFPSILIITVVAMLLSNFADNEYVKHAFSGIRAVVSALIAASVIKLIKKGVRSILQIILAVAAFIVVAVFELSPIVVVLGGILIGLACAKWGKAA